MNQIPNIEETYNTRDVEEKTDCELYDHIPVPYDVAFWHCKVCGKELYFDTVESLETNHHQLQKAREDGYNAGLADDDDDIPPLPKGKTLDDLIKDVWVDHSELDHQPDRPLNSKRD